MFGYAKPILSPALPVTFSSVAEAVNQNGDIVGFAEPAPSNTGPGMSFLYQNACSCSSYLPRPAGELNGTYEALAVNLKDQIVGNIKDDVDQYVTAFLYTNGASYDLNDLIPANSGWKINSAIAINNAGDIVGSGDFVDSSGMFHGNETFEMKP